jgi:hypothetical protein
MLFDELVLILNRLSEKPTTLGKDNASLEQLIEQIDKDSNMQLVSILRTRLESIRANYEASRTWRDKRVSHNDLSTSIGKDSDSLPRITRGQAEAAIKEVDEFMNEFSINALDTKQVYRPFMAGYGDGNALLRALKRGGLLPRDREAYTGST